MLEFWIAYSIAMGMEMEHDPSLSTVAVDLPQVEESGGSAFSGGLVMGGTGDGGAYAEGNGGAEPAGFGGEEIQREPEPQVPTGKYTTATEVRPILAMTKSNWVAVRLYEGRDYVYFSHLLAWRCGLWEIRYGINGNPPTEVFEMEPCNTEYSTPNAMIDVVGYPIYLEFPPESVETIMVEIIYDDGTSDFARASRQEVLIP